MSAGHPLWTAIPALADRLPVVSLGTWPTPLQPISIRGREVWLKREDLSDTSPGGYAGNKIRPLEVVFGAALAAGKREIWATGAYGSNHALATAVQARKVGLEGGAILWPQPWSRTAGDNLLSTASVADHLRFVGGVTMMPLAAVDVMARRRSAWVMPPGAATPLGAMGHAAAAIELATQLSECGTPPPSVIVLPVGSTCTTVGVLAGTALAAELGLLPRDALPHVAAVRVTPWPVTDRFRIARMAVQTARRFEALGAPRIAATFAGFLARLTVTGEALGRGYGHATVAGWGAIAEFSHHGVRLDTTYSAKAAAWLLERLSDASWGPSKGQRPIVFWVTKSAPPLPATDFDKVAQLPSDVRKWLALAMPKRLR